MAFSDKLFSYEEELPREVADAILEIEQYFSLESIKILRYDESHIVIPVEFNVSIPSRGTVDGIDIRPLEPMMVRISLTGYPFRIPALLSDREDFPKENLPHLYATGVNIPAVLCLVRNSPDEWFAGKRMKDFLVVGEQWLFKAAIGQLTEDGNEFDPLRLESYSGYHCYKYETLHEIVKRELRFLPSVSMAVMMTIYKTTLNASEATFKTLGPITFIQVPKLIQAEKKIGNNDNFDPPRRVSSVLVWNENGEVNGNYCTKLPSNFGELIQYFKGNGIDIFVALQTYVNSGLYKTQVLSIIHGVKRPKKIIGYSGEYEFINFQLFLTNEGNEQIPFDAPIKVQSHIEPFSSELAYKLSGEVKGNGILFVGAGSLGSKLIYHEARAGNNKLGVVDHDKFLHHNLARHVLGSIKIGENKAMAIVNELSNWYEFDVNKDFKAYPTTIENLQTVILKNYSWIIDSTASLSVQNWIALADIPSGVNIARCEIADNGNLGLLYIEGENRSPRLDDLINFTYYLGKDNMAIRGWRKRDSMRELTTIDIGLGCSSTTSVMPDDTISVHSAIFSKVLYKERQLSKDKRDGFIYLSILETEGVPKFKTEYYRVKPFESLQCNKGSGWEIRLKDGLKEEFFRLCRQNGRIETGGVLIGVANYKTKTIHIFEIIKEPKDSKGTSTTFKRGIRDLPLQVEAIKRYTGGVIGYVGEWHTHPMNLECLSATDMDTIQDLKVVNQKTPIPTLAIIVTNEKILPFVFE